MHKLWQIRLAIQLPQKKWHPIKGGSVSALPEDLACIA